MRLAPGRTPSSSRPAAWRQPPGRLQLSSTLPPERRRPDGSRRTTLVSLPSTSRLTARLALREAAVTITADPRRPYVRVGHRAGLHVAGHTRERAVPTTAPGDIRTPGQRASDTNTNRSARVILSD